MYGENSLNVHREATVKVHSAITVNVRGSGVGVGWGGGHVNERGEGNCKRAWETTVNVHEETTVEPCTRRNT